jgi:CRP/FNR family transcriptional regulator, cyclic AMP receptor protein
MEFFMNSLQEKDKVCYICEFQENLATLRDIDFFSELPLDLLKIIAYLCAREKYHEGDFLINKGEDDGQAFYIISGRAGLMHDSENNKSDMIYEYGAGKFLGGLSLIGKMRRLFSLKALEDTLCLVLTREKFSKAIAQFPDITPRLFQAVITRILNWEEKMFLRQGPHSDNSSHIAGVSLV